MAVFLLRQWYPHQYSQLTVWELKMTVETSKYYNRTNEINFTPVHHSGSQVQYTYLAYNNKQSNRDTGPMD